jgi:hypothetical protein
MARSTHFERRSLLQLGVLGYQRIFIENFLKLVAPLMKLTKKDVQFIWMEECTEVIRNLKRALMCEPAL